MIDTVASAVDGVTVAYESTGAGAPALVFVHGLSGDHSDFDGQVAYFAGTHLVVTLDLPGYGRSGTDRDTWTIATYGQDVASVADHLGLDDIVLIGHSLGGDVIVEAALRLGDRVRALVLVDSHRSLGHPMESEQIEQWLAPFHTDFAAAADDLTRRNFGSRADPEMVARVAARLAAADPEVIVQVITSKITNEPAFLRGLDAISVPTVAINGDHKPNDRASFDSHGVDLVVATGVGHFTMMEDSDTFNRLLGDAIGNLAGPS